MIIIVIGIFIFLYSALAANSTGHTMMLEGSQRDIRATIERNTVVSRPIVTTPVSPLVQTIEPVTDYIYPVEKEESEMVYKNIAKTKDPLVWWVCERSDLPAPSIAEQKIIDELQCYNVKWYREVSFQGLTVTGWSYPRFDICIQVKTDIGVVLIEYDGTGYHDTPHQKAMDKLKNKFCKDNGIPLIRWNRQQYHHIGSHVQTLMKQYNIRKIV